MSARALVYIAAGYLLGSCLFARVFGFVFKRGDVTRDSKDGNPGTANAFMYGGFWCGVLTLLGDLAKGFLPVFLFLHLGLPEGRLALTLVMAAPVVGHIFPLYFRFKGGKGIATTFGVLLGLLPDYIPLAMLVVSFLFYSVILRISPHFHRTILTYVTAAVLMFLVGADLSVCIGFLAVTVVVLVRLHLSREVREKIQVKLLWRR